MSYTMKYRNQCSKKKILISLLLVCSRQVYLYICRKTGTIPHTTSRRKKTNFTSVYYNNTNYTYVKKT